MNEIPSTTNRKEREKQLSVPTYTTGGALLGSYVRKKKMQSMNAPSTLDLAAQSGYHVFFHGDTNIQRLPSLATQGGPPQSVKLQHHAEPSSVMVSHRNAASSSPLIASNAEVTSQRKVSTVNRIVRRRQVSLDLLGEQGFFLPPAVVPVNEHPSAELEQQLRKDSVPMVIEEGEEGVVETTITEKPPPSKWNPFIFSPKREFVAVNDLQHGHGGVGGGSTLETSELVGLIKEQKVDIVRLQSEVKHLVAAVEATSAKKDIEVACAAVNLQQAQSQLDNNHKRLAMICEIDVSGLEEEEENGKCILDERNKEDIDKEEKIDDSVYRDDIIKLQKRDYYVAGILAFVMIVFFCIVIFWKTHVAHGEGIFGRVGLACVTPCVGDIDTRDFFYGDNTFGSTDVIRIGAYVDPVSVGGHNDGDSHRMLVAEESEKIQTEDIFLLVDILNLKGEAQEQLKLGPLSTHSREFYSEYVDVDSALNDPSEQHILSISSSNNEEISFTLFAEDMSFLTKHRVLVGALIMVAVYFFIVLEVIHRTLIAIYGSFVALFLFYIMHKGSVEEIGEVMLHMEWSTLGLLFGMMIIVGELSETGVFEWFAVRLMVASKGSYAKLMVLLCGLTALSSAFLDNVTTMLLIAPVTIDMCGILSIDPRPYLIGEVLLSNIGGTATLIGDPPNIIIGNEIKEIGFVDFITDIAPAIILLCLPVSLLFVVYLYRDHLNVSKPMNIDVDKLNKLYPIYDEPRLLLCGSAAGVVILLFFLHPVHHKDTAWIALFGAFMCMTFTHPHDVQTTLRHHVEWDTLLFFAGLFVLVEVVAAMGLLKAIGEVLADLIAAQPESEQLSTAISLIIWVSAFTSAFLDNIPYTATMIPVIRILASSLPETLPLKTLAWALSFGACLGGNGTLLGASANIVTVGISTSRGYDISFYNFFVPGVLTMILTTAIAHVYMLTVYVWI